MPCDSTNTQLGRRTSSATRRVLLVAMHLCRDPVVRHAVGSVRDHPGSIPLSHRNPVANSGGRARGRYWASVEAHSELEIIPAVAKLVTPRSDTCGSPFGRYSIRDESLGTGPIAARSRTPTQCVAAVFDQPPAALPLRTRVTRPVQHLVNGRLDATSLSEQPRWTLSFGSYSSSFERGATCRAPTLARCLRTSCPATAPTP